MIKFILLICLLTSCSQPTGPASLQLVPASYYSKYPGPRVSGGNYYWRNIQAKPQPILQPQTQSLPPPQPQWQPQQQPPSNEEIQTVIDNLTRDASTEAEHLNRRKRP